MISVGFHFEPRERTWSTVAANSRFPRVTSFHVVNCVVYGFDRAKPFNSTVTVHHPLPHFDLVNGSIDFETEFRIFNVYSISLCP